MPRALSTKRRFPLYLKSDIEDFPDESARPVFYFRPVTVDEWMQMEDLNKEARDKGGTDAVRIMFDLLRWPMVGWSNMTADEPAIAAAFGMDGALPATLPYKPELLEKMLGPEEATELMVAMLAAQKTSETEKGN